MPTCRRRRFSMNFSEQIKPISYLKSHAAEIVMDFDNNTNPLIITQNGEANFQAFSNKGCSGSRLNRYII